MLKIRDIKKYNRARISAPGGSLNELTLSVTVAWDGTHVDLSWAGPGYTYASGAYVQIFRSNQFLISLPPGTTSYRDDAVQSGQIYTYRVNFYS